MRTTLVAISVAAAAGQLPFGPDNVLAQVKEHAGFLAGALKEYAKDNADSSMVDKDNYFCLEGPNRELEAQLAIAKASIGHFMLSPSVRPRAHSTCAERGFTRNLGPGSKCMNNVEVFTHEGDTAVQEANLATMGFMRMFSAASNFTIQESVNLYNCTCEFNRDQGACASVADLRGSFVHHDPDSTVPLVCAEGPLVDAVYILAGMKSSPLLPMHEDDAISKLSCAERGFPHAKGEKDYCYTSLEMHSKTTPFDQDAGVLAAQTQGLILLNGGFALRKAGRDASRDLYNSGPCNCAKDSPSYKENCNQRMRASPVRSLWQK